HEKRQVADESYALGARVLLKLCTLPEQEELRESRVLNLGVQFPLGLSDRFGRSRHQFRRPLKVVGAVVSNFQSKEKRVVVKPVCLRVAELLVSRPEVGTNALTEILPSSFEQGLLKR